MGCDIHIWVEIKKEDKWEVNTKEVFTISEFDKGWHKKEKREVPFDWRSYGMYGFLADVRNYSMVPTIEGIDEIPEDASQEVLESYEAWEMDAHSIKTVNSKTLTEFDYTQTFNDRRVTKQVGKNSWSGGVTGTEEEGTTYQFVQFLGELFMQNVEELKELEKEGEVRLIFWFDN